jgi:hypothetical protein
LQRISTAVGDLVTDARVAILTFPAPDFVGEPIAFDQLDGSVAGWTGEGSFDMPATGTAGDLHCDTTGLRRLSRSIDVRVG